MNRALNAICEKAIKAAIRESDYLKEGSLRVLLVEGIDEDDQSELARQADEAQKKLKEFIGILPEEMSNTRSYFGKLHGQIPHPGEVLSLDLFGSKKEVAKKVTAISSIIEQVDNAQLTIINAFSMIKKFINAASQGIRREGGELSLSLTPESYAALDEAIWDISEFKKMIQKSFVKPKPNGFIAKAMRRIGDWWKKNVQETPVLMDLDTFAADVFRTKFSTLIKVGEKIESLRQEVTEDTKDDTESLEKIDTKLTSPETIQQKAEVKPTIKPLERTPQRPPIMPVEQRPEDRRMARASQRAKTRSAPRFETQAPESPRKKKVRVLGDIIKYRDPENRDKGYVYSEPKGAELMNAIRKMSKNPNAGARSAFKDAMNAVIGDEIFEQKNTEDDIIVEKWQRLAGIKL